MGENQTLTRAILTGSATLINIETVDRMEGIIAAISGLKKIVPFVEYSTENNDWKEVGYGLFDTESKVYFDPNNKSKKENDQHPLLLAVLNLCQEIKLAESHTSIDVCYKNIGTGQLTVIKGIKYEIMFD